MAAACSRCLEACYGKGVGEHHSSVHADRAGQAALYAERRRHQRQLDAIVVADQLIRLHGIDAPELDQTFWWRGQQITCGTTSLAALEALIAGVKVRCEVVERNRRGRLVAKVFSPDGIDTPGG